MDSENNDLLEELHQKHRKEKKELQGKLQNLKKSASKGDKKRKKEVAEEIAKLELETSERHKQEIANFKSKHELDTSAQIDELQTSLENGLTIDKRPSKAQRRREKKVTQQKEREIRIQEEDIRNLDGDRHLEIKEIKRILKERNLMLQEVPSDGNCLYNAVLISLKQLHGGTCLTLEELRSKTGNYLRKNKLEYLPYISHPVSGDILTESQFEQYCDEVVNTTAWGGEIELSALAHVLKKPIEVIQAKGPTIFAGTEYVTTNTATIVLTYHRHMYGLGEHYNSVTQYKEENQENVFVLT